MIFWNIGFVFVALEILVFWAVIAGIGFFGALGLWLLSVMIGGYLVRLNGLATLLRARESMDRGITPVAELFEGLCLFAAGALFIFPGFVSDAFAFMLLVAPIRSLLRQKAPAFFGWTDAASARRDDGVIDAEFTRVDEQATPLESPTHLLK